MDLLKIDKIVRDILRQVPNIVNSYDDLDVESKSAYNDLVTAVDKGVEKFLSDKLHEEFEGTEILGEETFDPEKDYNLDNIWVIDPIDGTTNFVKQGLDYSTIMTYFKDGKPQLSYIYDIVQNDLYSLIKDVGFYKNDIKISKPENTSLHDSIVSLDIKRMYGSDICDEMLDKCFVARVLGSAGLEGVRVSLGQVGAYANPNCGPWDFSTYYLMAELLDLHFSDLNGNPVNPIEKSSAIICTKQIAKDLNLI